MKTKTKTKKSDNETVAADALGVFSKTVLQNPYIPHKPHPKQVSFLLPYWVPELLYGGAAGGGKSDALLMAALQYVHVPGYRAVLFRRTFSDLSLPGALIPRSFEWLEGSKARYIDREHTWFFPNRASLTFGFLDHENAKYRYQGSEFQFIGFDELTQFKETQYTYLFSRLRKLEGATVPLRMRATTNPGGIGAKFVYERFIKEETKRAPFIFAKLEDNPSLDQEEYENSLKKLGRSEYQQLRHGVWRMESPNALWKRGWINDTRIQRLPKDIAIQRVVIGVDPSASSTGDAVGIIVAARGSNGDYYILEDLSIQASPQRWGSQVVRAMEKWNASRYVYESNQGGEMVEEVINNCAGRKVPNKSFYAHQGKLLRADHISVLYEDGHVHHVGFFDLLEDEMCMYTGEDGQASPNRLDALVLVLGELSGKRVGYSQKKVKRSDLGI